MRAYRSGGEVVVMVGAAGLRAFARRWPGSGIGEETESAIRFDFDARTGDLTDIDGALDYDGPDLVALAEDAQRFAEGKGLFDTKRYHGNPRVRDLRGGLVHDYQSAKRFLGDKSARKLANNTTILNYESEGFIAVKLHRTHIVRYWDDGAITLDSGGWRTATTRERIRSLLPANVSLVVKDGEWTVRLYANSEVVSRLFYDGITILPDTGEVIGLPHRRV